MRQTLEILRPIVRGLLDREGAKDILQLVSEEISDIATLSKTNHGPTIRQIELEHAANLVALASEVFKRDET